MKHLKLLQPHKLGADMKKCVTEMTGKQRLIGSESGGQVCEKTNIRWETVIKTKQECVCHLNLLNLRMVSVERDL